jgi:hypothetical protein
VIPRLGDTSHVSNLPAPILQRPSLDRGKERWRRVDFGIHLNKKMYLLLKCGGDFAAPHIPLYEEQTLTG